MENWVEIRKSADFMKMASEYGISPVTARILRNRDLVSPSEIENFLSPGPEAFHDPITLPGMNRVIFVLKEKIQAGAKIRIIGDYDVDGIASTYILYRGLKFLGAKADYVIPHRVEDGYGINIRLIDDAHNAGVDTILTCDNGIAAYDQTEHAKSLGMTMVITDHHEVPFEISESGEKIYKVPPADAVTDPKLPDSEYPFEGICGAFVAFKVIMALAQELGEDDSDNFKLLRGELTEFAALATVCDVMELKDENRSVVCLGLRLMRNSGNTGMKALIKVTGLEGRELTPYSMGFIVGPCLNASGRLDTSLKAVDLFLETDMDKAIFKAEELKNLNEERKQMTLDETARAFEIVDSSETIDKVLVVYLPDCHESLAGIIAGKVRERYVRPSFVITKTEKGLKGSGRSIEAYDMYEELTKVNEHMTKFGGHKLAAGVSLAEDTPDAFRKALNDCCTLEDKDFVETVRVDMELPLEYVDMNLAKDLEKLEPYGVGNEKPLFAARHMTIIAGRLMGSKGKVAKYKVKNDAGRIYEMIYFGDVKAFEDFVASIYDEETAKRLHSGNAVKVVIDVCYRIEINTYMGRDSVQLQMVHYR
ncbi:MAG: single-stranded-DNA-specific exonuclease RecJ [Lachnospiraceae bacterium]|nr:single-stranded-DNA-specific exonuclease RecJ [Lachnospiraceae bacterium]